MTPTAMSIPSVRDLKCLSSRGMTVDCYVTDYYISERD